MMSMPLPLPRRCAHGYSVRALTIVRKLNVWRAVFVIHVGRSIADRAVFFARPLVGSQCTAVQGPLAQKTPQSAIAQTKFLPFVRSAVPGQRLLKGDFLGHESLENLSDP